MVILCTQLVYFLPGLKANEVHPGPGSRDQPMLYDGFIRDDSALFDLPKPFELTIMDIPDHSFVKSEVSYGYS